MQVANPTRTRMVLLTEILDMILDFLGGHTPTLAKCMRVSLQMYQVIAPRLYTYLNWSGVFLSFPVKPRVAYEVRAVHLIRSLTWGIDVEQTDIHFMDSREYLEGCVTDGEFMNEERILYMGKSS